MKEIKNGDGIEASAEVVESKTASGVSIKEAVAFLEQPKWLSGKSKKVIFHIDEAVHSKLKGLCEESGLVMSSVAEKLFVIFINGQKVGLTPQDLAKNAGERVASSQIVGVGNRRFGTGLKGRY
jgi:hypothetical protein